MSTTTEPTAPKTLKEATALLAERETALAASAEKLASLEASHASHAEALSALTAERDGLKAQFDSAVEAAAKTGEELASLRGELETEKAARTAAEERIARADENAARLEKLCGVHGIDAAKAVSSGEGEPTGNEGTREGLMARYASLKTPGERAAFYAKHKASLLD